MSCSLDKLVSDLREMGQKEKKTLQETFPTTYTYLKNDWSNVGEDAFKMLTRKGVYPYEYIDSWEKFEEHQLPEMKEFYSKLTKSGITNEDYEFAKKLWETFELRNLGMLHDLYMNTDVMLLADVFEKIC